MILRPGGLKEEERDYETTNVQVDVSGRLPFPSRIGRRDVAELAIAACDLPADNNYTIACRWCGEGMKPKPQGFKVEGFPTAGECLQHLVEYKAVSPKPDAMRPYGLAVGVFVYSLMALTWKTVTAFCALAVKLFRK